MGTRSLLAVETKKDKYHVQYLQFDGYPSVRGIEFYTNVFKVLTEACFVDKSGNPSPKFPKMIKDILNVYQYKTGHSIANHWVIDAKDWRNRDSGQEWQYLFDKQGNFKFFAVRCRYNKDYTVRTPLPSPTYIIPWQLTHILATNFRAHNLEETQEVKVGERTMNLNFFERFFHKVEKTLNSDKEVKHPLLTIEQYEIMAFPEQKEYGWRKVGKIYVDDKVSDCVTSMFGDIGGEKRNVIKWQARVEMEEVVEVVDKGEKLVEFA